MARQPFELLRPGSRVPNRAPKSSPRRATNLCTVLGWLAIGREQVERILGAGNLEEGLQGLLFAESFLTRNTFTTAPDLHVANAATAHGNRFEQSSRMRVGLVSAEVVSATGNLGPPMVDGNLAELMLRGDPGAKNEAGNARLQVI